MIARVAGGTRAGRKRPLREPAREPWLCVRAHLNPPYATRCLTTGCNQKRAQELARHGSAAVPTNAP